MSNQVFIQQRTIILKCDGEQYQEIYICDDSYSYSIDLSEFSDSFYDDDIELLRAVLDRIKDMPNESLEGILDNIQACEKGINIEGTFYDWEEIKPVFKEFEEIES